MHSIHRPTTTGSESLKGEDFSSGSDVLRRFVFAIVGVLYGASLAALGWMASGAGHGTFFFFSVAVFPYGIGLILWPVIGYLLADVGRQFQRALFLIAILGRYALLVVYVVLYGSFEMPHIAVTWRYSHFDIIAPLVLFLAGQVLIWTLFLRRFFTAWRDAR